MIHNIENEYLSLSFNSYGGSMTSIRRKDTDEELQYQPDPRSWSGQDVVIFPFIARLKDAKYTVDGKEYSMKNHGLCRYNEFTLVENTGSEATIRFTSNEETRAQYPYDFVFEVTYKLIGTSIYVIYKVENKNDVVMPFGIGGHPALKVHAVENSDETCIDGATLYLDKAAILTQMLLDETGSFIVGEKDLGVVDHISFSKKFFRENPTFIVKADGINYVLLEKCNGEKIRYDFKCDYLALWSHPQYGDYLCVEPWMSVPDYMDAPSEMMEKKTLVHLEPGETFTFEYKITPLI